LNSTPSNEFFHTPYRKAAFLTKTQERTNNTIRLNQNAPGSKKNHQSYLRPEVLTIHVDLKRSLAGNSAAMSGR